MAKASNDMQDPVPFSRSPYWNLLRKYYQNQSLQAWNSKVPYHVTSNMNAAYSYAELLVAYYQDWVQSYGQPNKPLLIFELGAGSGRFSYDLLLALEDVATINRLDPACFKLIMSDFVEGNVRAWLDHPQLQPYFEKGVLDCMIFDVLSDPAMLCLHSRQTLSLEDYAMAPFFLAHYLLDSLPIDVFRVKEGSLYAAHVGLDVDKSSTYPKGDIRRITLEKRLLKVNGQYYKSNDSNAMLAAAVDGIKNGYFSFPVAAFKLLDKLHEVTQGKYIFACLDKGFVNWACFRDSGFPTVFYHDNAFSFDFNYCLLMEYLKRRKNHQLWITNDRQILKWKVISCGVEMDNSPHIDRFAQIAMEKNSLIDYAYLYSQVVEEDFDWPFSSLLSLLSLSNWDPVLFVSATPSLVSQMGDASFDERTFLFSYFSTVEKNYFQASDSGDVYLAIGRLYHAADLYDDAIVYFEKSLKTFGEGYAVYYALGKSYFSSGDSSTAMAMFANAQKFKVTKQLKSWIEYFGKDYRRIKDKMEKKREEKAKRKAKKAKEREEDDED
jgi:tetratricopeptide (TPR) repeat protein